tara:strand:- start:943 stop:1512 length:570 start_codon:yes stop_codon:yes gene_type:complete
MIYLIDNFLDKEFLEITQNYLNEPFQKVISGGKDFYVLDSNEDFNNYILSLLEQKEGVELENILSFFRVATDELDTKWRIHSDLNIKGQRPDRAIVLYLSPKELEELHGTAFWEHDIYGKELPPEITDEEYDRMLEADAEILEKWRLSSVVGYEENRLLSYPSSYFHSKFPNKAWLSGRKVFVMFYKFK